MSNTEPIEEKSAASMDDIFGNNRAQAAMASDVIPPLEDIQNAFEGKEPVVEQPKPTGFRPKVAPKTDTKTTAPVDVPEDDKITPQMIRAAEKAVRDLIGGMNGVKIKGVPEKPAPLDFSKLKEEDVYDLDIPIEVVDYSDPDYLKIDLKDTNCVARWIHKAGRRMGTMMAKGWVPIVKEDLLDDTILKLYMDVNGQYRYDDVIACKCQKSVYFGQLRKNHERGLAQVSSSKLLKGVDSALSAVGTGRGKTYRDYANEGKMKVYVPTEK